MLNKHNFVILAISGLLRFAGVSWTMSLLAIPVLFIAYLLIGRWLAKPDAKLMKKIEVSQELYHERKDAEFRAKRAKEKMEQRENGQETAEVSDDGFGAW